jgi:hypothetical protein
LRTWLTGWKRIANYLDVSVKVVQRRHKEYGMPVMRAPSNRPTIKPGQLDSWLKKLKDKKNGK